MYTRKFTLSHVIKSFTKFREEQSPVEEHFGVPWSIFVTNSEPNIHVYLKCEKLKEEDNRWEVSVDCTFKASKFGGEGPIEKKTQFKYQRKQCGDCGSFLVTELVKNCVHDNMLFVQIEATITDIQGVALKRSLDFGAPDEHKTDGVLLVGDEKFHVLKGMLAIYSPVFDRMFFGPYAEKDKKEIKLPEIAAESFHFFLEVIYGRCKDSIRIGTVENLLKLADRFDVSIVKDRCEEFLIHSTVFEDTKKFRLAETYNLTNLMAGCMSKINSLADAKLFLPNDLNEVGDSSLANIFRKIYSSPPASSKTKP